MFLTSMLVPLCLPPTLLLSLKLVNISLGEDLRKKAFYHIIEIPKHTVVAGGSQVSSPLHSLLSL